MVSVWLSNFDKDADLSLYGPAPDAAGAPGSPSAAPTRGAAPATAPLPQQRDLDRAGALLHQAFDFADRRRLLYDLARTAWSLEAWAELAASPEGTQWRSRRIEIFRELEVTETLPALPV